MLINTKRAQPLSFHFSWEEAETTSHRDIDNTIPPELYSAILSTSDGMERVRSVLSRPIHINSWYRSPELNASIGSSRTSQHPKGEAVDFICPSYGTPLQVVRELVKYEEFLEFDQLILEHSWVHISFCSIPHRNPRGQVLTLLRDRSYATGITSLDGIPLTSTS